MMQSVTAPTTVNPENPIVVMKRYELNFPLRHPRYVIEHLNHRKNVYRMQAWNSPWRKVGRSFWELWHNLKKGNFGKIKKAALNRLSIFANGKKY